VTAFTPIGFYDLSNLFASYAGKHKRALVESTDPRHTGVRYLDLLRDREPTETLQAWPSAQAFLQKVERKLAELPNATDVLHAYICAFDRDGFEAWGKEDLLDPEGLMRVGILLSPAPGFRCYSGNEAIAPAPWVATVVDHRAPSSRSNFNAPNSAHQLVLELGTGTGAPR
jgi:hypothetical protein